MAKESLAQQGTGPSSQERQQVQSTLGHPTTAVPSLSLVPPVGDEANLTHCQNDDQVASGGSFHLLLVVLGYWLYS
jgi:hypothetical protein